MTNVNIIHSKSEKVCRPAFSVKRNCGKLLSHFGSFLGHFGSYLGHFGPFGVIFGHFWAKMRKVQFFAGSLGSRYSLLECLQFCSTYNFKQSYEGAMHKGTNNSFLCSHWLLHILAKKEETNQGEAQQQVLI